MPSSNQNPQNPSDRRSFKRSAVMWNARIGVGDRAADGVLLNVSNSGAMMRVSDPFACPTSLKIEIGRLGRFAAKVVWRGLDEIGLRFDEAPDVIAARFVDMAPHATAA